MASYPKIVVLSTAWGPAYGGVNAFNADLCIALAGIGCSVICVVLDAGDKEIGQAHENKVRLLSLKEKVEKFSTEFALKIEQLLKAEGFTPEFFIGHDIITGPPTLTTRALFGDRIPCAILHHMHYLSYKSIESNATDADEKDQVQAETLMQADIVLAVGPRLANTARDMVRRRPQGAPHVYEIIPGLPKITALDAPSQFQLFFAGRLAGKSGKLKQVKLAVAAFGRAVANHGDDLKADPTLTLLGADQGETSTQLLKNLAQSYADRYVNILDIPFTTSRERLFNRLRAQTAAMLLSVHEGFGLTAWEAIGASIPLIISTNSGVYDFLDRRIGGPARGCVSPVQIKSSADTDIPNENDISTVVERIVRIAKNPAKARDDARKLREQLTPYTWENTAVEILRASGFSLQVKPIPIAPLAPPDTAGAVGSGQSTVASSVVLFDIYEPRCKPYYINRDVATQLADMQKQHLWLWGDSGTGKTTIIRHLLMTEPNYQYISLASCVGLGIPEVLEHLFLEISERLGHHPSQPQGLATNITISRIARLLTSPAAPAFIIHIDEVPIDQKDHQRDFSKAVAALLIEHTGIAPSNRTRYILSTIDEPTPHLSQAQAKIRERLATFAIQQWAEDELARICSLAIRELNLKVTPSQAKAIISRASGSPRFVKTCLRKMLLSSSSSSSHAWSFARILNETASEVLS